MALPATFLAYRGFRHLKLTGLLLTATTLGYALHDPVGGRHGGTPLGLVLGVVSAGLVLWLLAYGARRRSYAASGRSLRGWLSAHVYLGLALLWLVPLHCAFQFGWNVHSLAYALLVAVVASGMLGVLAYALVPGMLTRERGGRRFDSFLQEIADLDAECRAVAAGAPDAIARAVAVSIDETRIGGGLWRQLSGRSPGCGNERARQNVAQARGGLRGAARDDADRIAELLTRKDAVLRGVRRDLRQRALMSAWLTLHVPLSLAAVAAVGVHVFAVFWYR